MSVLRYTFTSSELRQEVTVIITLPEVCDDERLPFTAAVLLPDSNKESDFLLRSEPLERICATNIATVSLPGHIVLRQTSILVGFLTQELPCVLTQFPVIPFALFSTGASAAALSQLTDKLSAVYPVTQWGGCLETFITQLKLKEGLS